MFEVITLDGRKFRSITQSLSANQDDYIIGHLRQSGAIEIMGDLDGVKRSTEQRAEDLLTKIFLSGKTQHILAGCLTEEGKPWTRKDADANVERFQAITDEHEKLIMRSTIVEFIAGFFLSVDKLLGTSRKSSSPSEKDHRTKSAARKTSGTSRR